MGPIAIAYCHCHCLLPLPIAIAHWKRGIFQKSKNAKNCIKEAPQSSNPFHSNPKGGTRPSRIFLAHFPEIENAKSTIYATRCRPKGPGVLASPGHVIARSWPGPGQVLAVSWPGVGQSWPSPGQVSARSWPGAGQVLAWSWPGFGQVLAGSWPGIGHALVRSWGVLGGPRGSLEVTGGPWGGPLGALNSVSRTKTRHPLGNRVFIREFRLWASRSAPRGAQTSTGTTKKNAFKTKKIKIIKNHQKNKNREFS